MVEIVSRSRSLVGESPVWDSGRGALWWTDIRGRRVRRFDQADGAEHEWTTPELAGGIALAEDGTLYGVFERGLFRLDGGGAFRFVSGPDDVPSTHRFNDVTVDPSGRLIAGTMREASHGPAPTGTLYAYDGVRWRTLMEGFWTVNGLAFSADGGTMWVSDSHPDVRKIWRCAYDPATGAVGERQVFVDMTGYAGRPDGAALDAEGAYWIAGVGGGRVYRFSPEGALIGAVELPIERPTKPCFGGPELDRLYVTSLSVGLDRTDPVGRDGALLRLDAGVRGAPTPPLRLASRQEEIVSRATPPGARPTSA